AGRGLGDPDVEPARVGEDATQDRGGLAPAGIALSDQDQGPQGTIRSPNGLGRREQAGGQATEDHAASDPRGHATPPSPHVSSLMTIFWNGTRPGGPPARISVDSTQDCQTAPDLGRESPGRFRPIATELALSHRRRSLASHPPDRTGTATAF